MECNILHVSLMDLRKPAQTQPNGIPSLSVYIKRLSPMPKDQNRFSFASMTQAKVPVSHTILRTRNQNAQMPLVSQGRSSGCGVRSLRHAGGGIYHSARSCILKVPLEDRLISIGNRS
jgi:hypothetical protein